MENDLSIHQSVYLINCWLCQGKKVTEIAIWMPEDILSAYKYKNK